MVALLQTTESAPTKLARQCTKRQDSKDQAGLGVRCLCGKKVNMNSKKCSSLSLSRQSTANVHNDSQPIVREKCVKGANGAPPLKT
eukprot:324362-Amphidinium_carterae.1